MTLPTTAAYIAALVIVAAVLLACWVEGCGYVKRLLGREDEER